MARASIGGLLRLRNVISCAIVLASVANAYSGECRALIVSGDPGMDGRFAENFDRWAREWEKMLSSTYGFKTQQVRVLTSPAREPLDKEFKPKPALMSVSAENQATRDNVIGELAKIVRASGAADQVVLVVIGHAYQSEGTGKISLPGRDLADVDLVETIKTLKAKQFLFFNMAPDGPGWAKALAGKGRLTMVANVKQSAPYFSEFLLRELKPGNVNLLDAFNRAALKTVHWYENQWQEKGKEGEIVHGKENQEVYRSVYPDRPMVVGNDQPKEIDNAADAARTQVGRRVLVEAAGLEDDGDGLPSTVFESGIDPKPLPSPKSKDGGFAKTVVLGKP